MRGPTFVLFIIILILIGAVAGYIIGTNKYPTLSTAPLTTIAPTQTISPLPSPTVVLSPTGQVTPTKSTTPTLTP